MQSTCSLVKLTRHHPPLLLTIDAKLPLAFVVSSIVVSYDSRKADHRSITELLSSLDWGDILDCEDIEVAEQQDLVCFFFKAYLAFMFFLFDC